jgi:PadR family transcriptional regulator PadR
MTQLEKNFVWQGTLSLMVLRTLLTMGERHGHGIARRIEQTGEGKLSINHGTLYPALLRLEQEGLISSEWGVSDNNRKASSTGSPRPAGSRSSAIRGSGRRRRRS